MELTTTEVAARLGVSRVTIQGRCWRGEIPGARRAGRDWLIPEASLAKMKPVHPRPRRKRKGAER